MQASTPCSSRAGPSRGTTGGAACGRVHGAYRPLWLCDVAAMLESLPDGFDWDTCLGRATARSDWVTCAVRLAVDVLRASVRAPRDVMEYPIPPWLVRDMLHLWGDYRQPERDRPLSWLTRPPGLYDSGRYTWVGLVNPLRAAQRWRGPLRDLPRFSSRIWLVRRSLLHLCAHLADRLYRLTPYPRRIRLGPLRRVRRRTA